MANMDDYVHIDYVIDIELERDEYKRLYAKADTENDELTARIMELENEIIDVFKNPDSYELKDGKIYRKF